MNRLLRIGFVCLFLFFVTLPVSVRSAELPIGAPGWQPNARSFLFNVPFFRQRWSLSCELASLRSSLRAVGVDVTEQTLWSQIAKDPTPRRRLTDGMIAWGDPRKGFVGKVTGRQPTTGYGVFLEPLMEVASRYASTTRIRLDDSYAIDRALRQGHPIVAWTVIGNPSVTTWKTPDGKVITVPIREHTVVIVGYRGSGDAIEGVYVIDPLTGLRYETWAEFQSKSAYFDFDGLEVGKR
ncbi:MAG: C39 family peptidase [Candidatus Uhrbacteria bacterium]|nr:C39 family peptidase [Candidatus Uhrbacteria bacterium]